MSAGFAQRSIPPPVSLQSPAITDLPSPHPSTATDSNQPPLEPKPPPRSESMATADFVRPVHMMQPFTRPIRFVSSDGLPHTKRRRISAACKTCRKRKTRCSGEKPVCETCRQNGHDCLGYSDPPTQSGSQPLPGNHQESSPRTPTRRDSIKSEQGPASNVNQTRRLSQPSFSPLKREDEDHRHATASKIAPHIQSPEQPPGKRKFSDDGLKRRGSTFTEERPRSSMRFQSPPTPQRLANRVPYFRYFGPTAIVPGYKQMVVEVRNAKRPVPSSRAGSITSPVTSPASTFASIPSTEGKPPDPTVTAGDRDLPFYDPHDTAPNHPLISHLVETFFAYVGCSFPFLRHESFVRDVEDKLVDAILVDALCGVAARFSTHALLKKDHRSDAGTVYENRVKSQIVDTFACPTLSAVQACVLLAYAEFGGARDSGLWMFLGIAIRMAQDLGLQKLEGMKGERKGRNEERKRAGSLQHALVIPEEDENDNSSDDEDDALTNEEIKEAEDWERERTDTFWAVFFLDRVISSGTGRPVTLQDKDIEIELPSIDEVNCDEAGYPQPFPALVRIIHLYGRATDLLNNIRDVNGVTQDTMRQLSGMEADLTGIYQRLSPKLHFSVNNFQHYAKTDQSSVFLLMHFWFHALIVLLHRPTLFIGFEGGIRKLFPNSHELSMSSAKTIADIVAFAELLDLKAVAGNPFTSQPIYIAACAFLQESTTDKDSSAMAALTPPNSAIIPPEPELPLSSDSNNHNAKLEPVPRPRENTPSNSHYPESKSSLSRKSSNHSLLAQAAQQNYQRCYKAVKAIETYWQGVRYILTVMDQKVKGIMDPLLYTNEDMEAVDQIHRWGAGVWNRFTEKLNNRSSTTVEDEGEAGDSDVPGSKAGNEIINNASAQLGFQGDWSQAIGWSVTGLTNSPSSNLTFLYQAPESPANYHQQQQPPPPSQDDFTPQPTSSSLQQPQQHQQQQQQQAPVTNLRHQPSVVPYTPPSPLTTHRDAEMLLGMSSSTPAPALKSHELIQQQQQQHPISYDPSGSGFNEMHMFDAGNNNLMTNGYGITLESGDVDFAALGVDMGGWLGYLPSTSDAVAFYGANAETHGRGQH